MKKIDRYSLLCFSVAAIILLAVFINTEEPAEENGIIGIAYDVKQTQNGFTFFIEDVDGGKIKCFVRSEPAEMQIYEIKGTFSEDGSIMFVSSMNPISKKDSKDYMAEKT